MRLFFSLGLIPRSLLRSKLKIMILRIKLSMLRIEKIEIAGSRKRKNLRNIISTTVEKLYNLRLQTPQLCCGWDFEN